METLKGIIARILYGSLFILIIPAILIIWAISTEELITLPVPGHELPGYVLLASGLIFMVAGMVSLITEGGGLPMSAFPPKKLVKSGIYALTRHPIYLGAIFISFGIAVIFRSPSGFWLVSPMLLLMILAWLAGFENERTGSLFDTKGYKTFISRPDPDERDPSAGTRISAYLLAFIPWCIIYEAFIFAGIPRGAVPTNLWFEKDLPVWEFTEAIYAFTYLFVILIPVVIRTGDHLRQFINDVWFATFIAGLFYFVFPMFVRQRDFFPETFLGRMIMLERSLDGETCALPSFHVIWAFIAARYFSLSAPHMKWLWFLTAILISLSCVTTGHHSLPDVLAGFVFWIIIRYRSTIWDFIRQMSEDLANSWREWRIGPMRIINHGFYGGAAGFIGTLLAGCFLGPRLAIAAFLVMLFVIIGAGLWAQVIEGSSKLLRPYGYYGGVAGVLAGCAVIALTFRISYIIPLASFAMAGPWIQAAGRLRCLVQGCCHGKPCNEKLGIRFTHPLSRVNKISGLKGMHLHPTQLYSIGCNIVSGLILIRFYTMGMPAVFITGVYLILNGLGRFVEEAMRGEAQTPYLAGMRIYQWIAILNIAFGIVLTCLNNSLTLHFQFSLTALLLAIPMGIIVMFASGCDFPESDRRFARLTSN